MRGAKGIIMSLERSWRQLIAKVEILCSDVALSHLSVPEVLKGCSNWVFSWVAAGGELPGNAAQLISSAGGQYVQLTLSSSQHLSPEILLAECKGQGLPGTLTGIHRDQGPSSG